MSASRSNPFALITPAPATVHLFDEQCDLSAIREIVVESRDLMGIAKYLLDKLQTELSSWNLSITQSDKIIPYSLHLAIDQSYPKDHYRLRIASERLHLTAGSDQSMMHAVQSCIQVFEFNEAICSTGEIHDAPRFSYRGLHLDVSRHFRPTQDIKSLLELMAFYKLNVFHWHLADDQGWRIPIPAFDRLISVGATRTGTVLGHTLDKNAKVNSVPHHGFYSKAELLDIVNYANMLGITIIPEIDLPGHSSALLAAYPELACVSNSGDKSVKPHFGIFKNVVCTKESVFEFLESVFTELAEIFPSKYFHIGGDEVKSDYWETCSDCQSTMRKNGLSSTIELHGHFIKKVLAILQKLGKQAVCWDDVLVGNHLDSEILITSWLGDESAREAAKRGHQVVMTQSPLYFDFYPSLSPSEPLHIHGHSPLKSVYNYKPDSASDGVIGAQANVWTEYLDTKQRVDRALFPRSLALAEILWSPPEKLCWKTFLGKLELHQSYLDSLNINHCNSHFIPELSTEHCGDGSIEISLASDFPKYQLGYKIGEPDSTTLFLDYLNPIRCLEATSIIATHLDSDKKPVGLPRMINVTPHLGIGQSARLIYPNKPNLQKSCAIVVTGETEQNQIFQHDKWLALENEGECLIEIDLGISRTVRHISIGTDGALGRELYRPTSIGISHSMTGNVYSNSVSAEYSWELKRYVADFRPTQARTLRIQIENKQFMDCHEDEQRKRPTLYIDEIIVL